MDNFIRPNLYVRDIMAALRVPAGVGEYRHRNRPYHGLVYNEENRKEYHFDSGYITIVESDSLLYLPKGSNYIVTESTPGACTAINFTIEEDLHCRSFAYQPRSPKTFHELFKRIEKTFITKRSGYIMESKSILYEILLHMIKDKMADYIPMEKQAKIKTAVKYIEDHYMTDVIRISKLAEMSHISEVYFRRIFKELYGMSPIKYINLLKVSRAREMIDSGVHSITEVMIMSGFHDHDHFITHFRKVTGMTPAEYRKD